MRLFTTPKRMYQRLEREHYNSVLDVGVGRKKFSGAVGIDMRENSLADVRHNLNQFPWPFEENRFDLILCRHVLEHIPATDKVMEEVYRICKPDGKVVLEVPHFSNVEAYRHWQHVHFFTANSFDYFCDGNTNYKTRFRIEKRKIFFDDLSRVLLIECLANIFTHQYERRFAFIFPAGSIYLELMVVK
jgi:SAM-dependent methyltransferase